MTQQRRPSPARPVRWPTFRCEFNASPLMLNALPRADGLSIHYCSGEPGFNGFGLGYLCICVFIDLE